MNLKAFRITSKVFLIDTRTNLMVETTKGEKMPDDEARRQAAIQKSVSMKNLLDSPSYIQLLNWYEEYNKARTGPAREVYYDLMIDLLSCYGFSKTEYQNYGKSEADVVFNHLFMRKGAGGPSRAW